MIHPWIVLLLLGCTTLYPFRAAAQITAGGLSTRVNGSAFGSCSTGSCTIHGGVKAGPNLFYRVNRFDTRSGIRDVLIQSQNKKNIIFSVNARSGSFIHKPIELSNNANLFWLSPGGIAVGSGASFTNVSNLLLSTSARLPFGGRFDKDIYDSVRSSASQVADLDQAPILDFDTLSNESLLDYKGFVGLGSITLEGGLIEVEKHLLIDATSGSLRLGSRSDLSLMAGESIRLRANQININDSQLTAGEGGRGGLIDLQAIAINNDSAPFQSTSLNIDFSALKVTTPFLSRPGKVSVANSNFESQRIVFSGNQIDVDQSVLNAPKGMIQLSALATPGSTNSNPSLSISRSTLDVSPTRVEHISFDPVAPLTKPEDKLSLRASRKAFSDTGPNFSMASLVDKNLTILFSPQESKVYMPVISLMSEGSIDLAQANLIASFDLARISSLGSSLGAVDFSRIANRSGQVLITAARDITLNQVNIDASASNNKSGFIYMQTGWQRDLQPAPKESDIPQGKIEIFNSVITANGGAGNGVVFLLSNYGISIDNTLMEASNNRFPVVDGQAYGMPSPGWDPEYFRPYAFWGGRILLFNQSETVPLLISASRLVSNVSSDGGGLASSMFALKNDFPFMGTFDMSIYGTYGDERAFSVGLDFDNTGGKIMISSKGGVSLANNTQLDVSSGQRMPENNAGFVEISSGGDRGVTIENSSILGVSGNPRDLSNTDLQLGRAIISSKGDIALTGSRIDLSSTNQIKISPDNKPALAMVWLESVQGNISLNDSYVNTFYSLSDYPYYEIVINSIGFSFANSYFSVQPQLVDIGFGFFVEPPHLAVASRIQAPFWLPLFTSEGFFLGSANSPDAAVDESMNHLEPDDIPGSPRASSADPDSSPFSRAEFASLSQVTAALGLPQGTGRLRSVGEVQQALLRASEVAGSQSSPQSPATAQVLGMQPLKLPVADLMDLRTSNDNKKTSRYVPAVLRLQRDDLGNGTSRITAIVLRADASPISRSTTLASHLLNQWIRLSQLQLSRRSLEAVLDSREAKALAQHLFGPIADSLQNHGITALLLSVDRGLQGVPYAVLPFDGQPLAERFALTVTPSLGLIDLDPSRMAAPANSSTVLLAGATQFRNGLASLPMVKEELQVLSSEQRGPVLLNDSFTPQALVQQAQNNNIRRLHIASHASFKPGNIGMIYTTDSSLSLKQLGRGLVFRNSEQPLDLISLSGCLTALGDEDSELGFVGMALQAGARSGIGTLWEVDDTATAAFFIQFYRYLQQGLSKDLALQATQRAFLRGVVRLEGDQLVGPTRLDGSSRAPLVSGISREERQLFAQGLSHPYYWAGMVLTGSPW